MDGVYAVEKYVEVLSVSWLKGEVEKVVTTNFLKEKKVVKTIYYDHKARTKFTEVVEFILQKAFYQHMLVKTNKPIFDWS